MLLSLTPLGSLPLRPIQGFFCLWCSKEMPYAIVFDLVGFLDVFEPLKTLKGLNILATGSARGKECESEKALKGRNKIRQ